MRSLVLRHLRRLHGCNFGVFRETLPENWERIRDTVTDNFRVISTSEYKFIGEQSTHQDRQALSA